MTQWSRRVECWIYVWPSNDSWFPTKPRIQFLLYDATWFDPTENPNLTKIFMSKWNCYCVHCSCSIVVVVSFDLQAYPIFRPWMKRNKFSLAYDGSYRTYLNVRILFSFFVLLILSLWMDILNPRNFLRFQPPLAPAYFHTAYIHAILFLICVIQSMICTRLRTKNLSALMYLQYSFLSVFLIISGADTRTHPYTGANT